MVIGLELATATGIASPNLESVLAIVAVSFIAGAAADHETASHGALLIGPMLASAIGIMVAAATGAYLGLNPMRRQQNLST